MKLLNSAVQDLDTLSSVFYGGSQSSLRKLNSLRRLDLLRYESEELLTKSTMGKKNIYYIDLLLNKKLITTLYIFTHSHFLTIFIISFEPFE